MQSPRTSNPEPRTSQPPCPHFGPCGGCQLQHLTYPAQLALKAAHLRTLLDAAELTLPELQIHASPPLAYRNRIRLTLAEVAGQLRAGYFTSTPEPANLGFLPITECPIAAPILWRTTEALLALLNADPALWLRNAQFKLDQLELFTAADESALQFTLYLRTAAKSLPAKLTAAFPALCEALRARIPQLTGAKIALLPPISAQRSRRTEVAKPGPTWGNAGLNYTVAPLEPRTPNLEPPLTYWLPRGAFFQINRFLLPELLTLVTANRTGQLAWDLYAGVGLFSRMLARVVERDRPDLIVLDPPRSGAGAEVCALLSRIAAPTLIYVSCSPETLPPDLATLAVSGYSVTELHLFDLFPQTTHIETVAVLTHGSADSSARGTMGIR